MTRRFYLEGKLYGILSVTSYENEKYLCRCECGKEIYVSGSNLRSNDYSSCGCKRGTKKNNLNKCNKKTEKTYSLDYEVKSKQRFFSFVEKTDRCWNWKGFINHLGYGKFQYKGKTCASSRVIWAWENGEIPKGKLVCHHCDNRKCVNPTHLFVGSQKDNMQDMYNKGRWKYRKFGSKIPGLTPFKIGKIRKYLASGVIMKDIAKRYDVSINTIKNIKYRKSWKHVVS
jgi:hypothetical protein